MDVERWLAAALGGDDAAWVKLLGALWERVERQVGASRRMGQLRGSEDHRREVVSRVFARLRRNDLRALRTFGAWRARHRDKTLDDWLAIVVANVIRDYVSERIGGDGLRRLVDTLAETLDGLPEDGARPAITDELDAARLLDAARAILGDAHFAILARWLRGESFDEIAAGVGFDRSAARRQVRAALARLRRDARPAA